jgi:hypothetical protein
VGPADLKITPTKLRIQRKGLAMSMLSRIRSQVSRIKEKSVDLSESNYVPDCSKIVQRIVNEYDPTCPEEGYARYGKKSWPSDHGRHARYARSR